MKKNIYIMYIMACLQGMVFYGPIATLYRQAQGVSILEITLIESISLALCLLLELPWGIIADKIGYRNTMIICSMLYFISKLIFWQAESFHAFLAERILLSVVVAGLSGVETSILYLSCENIGQNAEQTVSANKLHSQHVFGIYEALQTGGLLLAAFIYSVVIGENYKLAGLFTVFSYGLAAVFSLFLTEVKKTEECRMNVKEFLASLRQILTNKYLLLFLIGIAFFNETHQIITVFLNQPQYIKCGLNPTAIGYIYIFVTILGLCGVFSYRLTKKMGRSVFMGSCYATAIVVCAVLAFTESAVLSVAGIMLLRVVFSLAQPLFTEIQNEQIVAVNRATMLSINAVVMESVGVGTNVLFGAMTERSLSWAFLLGVLLCVAGWGMVVVSSKAKRQCVN